MLDRICNTIYIDAKHFGPDVLTKSTEPEFTASYDRCSLTNMTKSSHTTPARTLIANESIWGSLDKVLEDLCNNGKQCYSNATLQCLLGTPPIREYCIEKGDAFVDPVTTDKVTVEDVTVSSSYSKGR